MIYRLRIYQAVPEQMQAFHAFFQEHLLPVQLRHGARLVGRWQTEDDQVVAVWEYDDRATYETIESAVHADPATAIAQQHRATLEPLFTTQRETFMCSTVDPAP